MEGCMYVGRGVYMCRGIYGRISVSGMRVSSFSVFLFLTVCDCVVAITNQCWFPFIRTLVAAGAHIRSLPFGVIICVHSLLREGRKRRRRRPTAVVLCLQFGGLRNPLLQGINPLSNQFQALNPGTESTVTVVTIL